ncbi:MAG: glycosyltransferase family 2 protein [Lentisphaeria bacterium]|nr:glycosyltransferase family 2 protein [Lentisphaeria bacterium]
MNTANKAPLLSVIVPVFNTEQYLEKSLNSLLSSTLKDLEIIIIDDGSTDSSPEICDKFKADNPDWNIKVIHKKNEGQSSARNLGQQKSHGKYVTFCDSDDWVEPELFSTLVSAAEENSAQAAICGIKYYNEVTKKFEYHTDSLFPSTLTKNTFNIETCKSVIRGLLDCSPCNKVYLRSFIEQHKISFDVQCNFAEDNRFWAEYFLAAERLCLVNGGFYVYRINQNRQTICTKAKKSYDSFAASMMIIRETFERHKLLDHFRGELIAFLAIQISVAYCNILSTRKKSFYKECMEVLKTCKHFSFAHEGSFAVRLHSMYIYAVFRFLPFTVGNIAMLPLQILRNSKIKKFLRRFAA